jgi:hypothetical protein
MSGARGFGGSRVGIAARALMVGGVVALGALALNPLQGRADMPPTFAADYVSSTLAGGEPFIIYSHAGNDLIYAAHEGTTHLDRNGIPQADSSCDILPPGQIPSGYICEPYDNHINQWYSTDGGATWILDAAGPGGNPLGVSQVPDTGFSDPSLTEDAPAGNDPSTQNVYDTGIDLANDALYASNDGGQEWGGTPQCQEGDRPWLAGGHNGEIFLATDLEGSIGGASGHAYVYGQITAKVGNNVGAITCNILHPTQDPKGGDSQDYYDHITGDIVEGAQFGHSGGTVGEGVGVMSNASSVWGGSLTAAPSCGATGCFQDHEGTNCTTNLTSAGVDPALCTELGPIFPDIAIDQGNTTYVVWATGAYSTTQTGNGCTSATAAGGPNILPNSVYMMSTPDEGQHWSLPEPIATPATSGGNTVLWPWITAGAAGNVAIVWYQSNQLTDPDCDSAALQPGGHPTKWTLQEATIFTRRAPHIRHRP